jgi:hypothetical protein
MSCGARERAVVSERSEIHKETTSVGRQQIFNKQEWTAVARERFSEQDRAATDTHT